MALPVDAIVTKSIVSLIEGVNPPAHTPLVLDATAPVTHLLATVRFPKSIAFPAEEIFT